MIISYSLLYMYVFMCDSSSLHPSMCQPHPAINHFNLWPLAPLFGSQAHNRFFGVRAVSRVLAVDRYTDKLAVTRANKCAREAVLIQISQIAAVTRFASHLLFYISRTLVGCFISVARWPKHNCTGLRALVLVGHYNH